MLRAYCFAVLRFTLILPYACRRRYTLVDVISATLIDAAAAAVILRCHFADVIIACWRDMLLSGVSPLLLPCHAAADAFSDFRFSLRYAISPPCHAAIYAFCRRRYYYTPPAAGGCYAIITLLEAGYTTANTSVSE